MTHAPSNLTNTRLGSWLAVKPTGETCRYTITRIWLFRCDCGAERRINVSDVRQYQRRSKAPRCACQTEFAKRRASAAKPKPVVPVRRAAEKIDGCYCCGLSWRVPKGKRCTCGRVYEPEPPVEFAIPTGSSPAARCIEFAPGISGDDYVVRRRVGKERAA